MKPLNFDNSPCTPTSSNCVIWAGPDLACINLCKGDNITDVTEKLATEICGILDTLNINSYDLDCFNLANCAPQTFKDLINFLIVKICQLENLPVNPDVPGTGDCPSNCIVEIASCFVQNGVTTMSLTEYAIAIGERICTIVSTIQTQQVAINSLNVRVTTLENTPPPAYTTPTMTMGCDIATLSIGSTQGIDTVIRTFINDIWCTYVSTTGDAGCLATAVANQTVSGTDLSKANPSATMAVQYAGLWVEPATTVCDSINNIWASIEDLRNVSSVTVSGANTSTINVSVSSGPNYVVSANLVSSPTSVVQAGNGIDVTSSTLGTVTTYTVSTLGAMRAQSTPSALPKITATASTNLKDNGVTQLMSQVYDDDNAYDPVTGIWTCPATGRYDFNFYVHITNVPDGSSGFNSGTVVAGLVNSSGYLVVSTMAITNIMRHVDITGSALSMNITAGTQYYLNILNMSDINYLPHNGDVARFSVQRVR